MKTDIRNALKKIPLQLKYLAEEHYKDMWIRMISDDFAWLLIVNEIFCYE
jgi:hypothetical protein